MADFTLETGADGVAVIAWDLPDRSMNVMSFEGMKELGALAERALGDDSVKGLVVTSGKDSFAGGMDLNVLARMRDGAGENPAQGIFDGIMSFHEVIRRIERAGMDPKSLKGGKPVACALPGTALGIGYEIALGCHRIFAAPNPRARIGLPEILVGLFPGAGGTTRLVRMMGAMAAAPFLLEGRTLAPEKAKAAGLVHEVVEDPLAAARAWVLEADADDLAKPWDRPGYRMPGGAPYHPAGFQTFVGAAAMVHGKTKGVYPAAKALLAAVYEGALVPFDTALRIETRHFASVLLRPESSAMIRSLFVNKGALEKGARRPDVEDQAVRKVGILGAGMMGAGISLVSARAGIDVVLVDRTRELADKGRSHAEAHFEKAVGRGRATEEERDAALARIEATDDVGALGGCDLVVEAVFEDPDVKAETTRKVEEEIPEDCVFASNTSTLPITGLAEASRRPGQFVGIHFFSPVERMMLVEIIRGKETGERAVAKALDYVRQIRKTPIVVNDARFFYANRCIIPYANEGFRMVREGVEPALVENAAKLLGFPLGPLQLTDETSIELSVRIAKATKAALGDAYDAEAADEVTSWLQEEGRLGRKAGAGFYAYDEKGRRTGLWDGLRAKFGGGERPDVAEVKHRLMMAQVLEAVRAMEEGVLTDIREGDVGAVLGWGFAPWSGGPFSWLDMISPKAAVEICDGLAARHGARFEAPALLREKAESGSTFY